MKNSDVETMIVGLRAEMSVQEIARRTGLSRQHVHKIAAGEVRRPSYDTRLLTCWPQENVVSPVIPMTLSPRQLAELLDGSSKTKPFHH